MNFNVDEFCTHLNFKLRFLFDGKKLLRSYLSNRTQAVSMNGKMPSFKPITCGIPQDSILGPLLLLIYINDLPYALLNQPIDVMLTTLVCKFLVLTFKT